MSFAGVDRGTWEGMPVSEDITTTNGDTLTPGAEAEIIRLAGRSVAARGVLMKVAGFAGAQAENALEALPDGVKDLIEGATGRALELAYRGAEVSGKSTLVPEMGRHGHALASVLSGAAGGFAGLGSAIVEIPFTVSIIFAAIQKAARAEGFDPQDEEIRRHCLLVFAAGDPADRSDDGMNTSFLMTRTLVTGASVHRLIASVAPRLATVLSQKLATQTFPVLGSVAGAGINFAFTRYYQDLAEVRFALLRLAREHGETAVQERFAAERTRRRRVGSG